jgi:hypothetical protein
VQSLKRGCEIEVGRSIGGIDLDGSANQLDRLRRIPAVRSDDSRQVQGVGVLGIGAQDLIVHGLRSRQIPVLVLRERQVKFFRASCGGGAIVHHESLERLRGYEPNVNYSIVSVGGARRRYAISATVESVA